MAEEIKSLLVEVRPEPVFKTADIRIMHLARYLRVTLMLLFFFWKCAINSVLLVAKVSFFEYGGLLVMFSVSGENLSLDDRWK